MKWITVNAYEIAVITKRGKLIDVLAEGFHWIGFGKQVVIYDVTQPIDISRSQLALFAENESLNYYFSITSIEDNELGIEMKDGNFSRILPQGKYLYWHSPISYVVDKVDISDMEVSPSIPKYILMKPAVLQYLKVYTVESYQKGLLFIDGKYEKELEPGTYYYWKINELAQVKTIDTRIQYIEVSGQEILTKDKAGIRINFSTQYLVNDINKALIDTKDYEKQLYTIIQLSLREYTGTMTLDQLLASKEAIGPYILKAVKKSTAVIGVELISCGIKDIILPGDVKDIMNQVLIAQKKAQANTIMRQEETASTRSLLNTAKLMEDNAMLLKLKEMEYMEKISDKIGEITVNGGGRVFDQFKQLVVSK